MIVDRFMGQRTVVVPTDGKTDRYTGRLMGRRRHRELLPLPSSATTTQEQLEEKKWRFQKEKQEI